MNFTDVIHNKLYQFSFPGKLKELLKVGAILTLIHETRQDLF